MDGPRLDDVDVALLTLLQADARQPAIDLADRVGVSDNTVHNRIQRLLDDGVITGFTATLDPEEMGFDLQFMFVCTVRISQRGEVAREVRSIPAVTEVTELMTGQRNLLVKAVARTDEDITAIAERVDEFDLEITDEVLVRAEHANAIDYAAIREALDDERE